MARASGRGTRAPRREGCLLLTAAAGYGKTTALESAYADGTVAYHRARDLALEPDRPAHLDAGGAVVDHVVVDDLAELAPAEQVAVARVVAGIPDGVRVSLGTRQPLTNAVRAALPSATERSAADLALAPAAVAAVLREEHGVADAELAYRVHELTAGWPALVRLAGAALHLCGPAPVDLLAKLAEPGSDAAAWLRDSVLADLPRRAAGLLDALADLQPVTAPLCAELAAQGVLGSPGTVLDDLRRLVRTGLVVACPTLYRAPAEPTYHVVPALAAVLRRRRPPTAPGGTALGRGVSASEPRRPGQASTALGRGVSASEPRRPGQASTALGRGVSASEPRRPGQASTALGRRLRAAADWYAANGQPLAAARVLRRAGDEARCRAVLEEYGEDIVAAGGGDLVPLIEAVPAEQRSLRLRILLADALRVNGDVVGAQRAFAPLLAGASRLPAALAWRAARVSYMRSDYRAALEMLSRAEPVSTQEPPTVDDALVGAWRASALAMLGELVRAEAVADEAVELARAASRDSPAAQDRAFGAAHMAGALATVGTRRERHLADALAAAERAGDLVLLSRVLVNQADSLLREARYVEALDVAARGLRAAERAGPLGLLTVALCNAGEALRRLGRYDEAALRFERAVLIARRVAPNRAAMGLWGLAELHRLLGRREQARSAFEEAVELALAADDPQVSVPALTGLVRLLLDGTEPDVTAARAAAEEAERIAPTITASLALAARGWVALADGDLEGARERAAAAVAAARASRRADCLAESLELAAATSAEPARARAALQEAEAIWRRAGAAPAADQMVVLVGRLPGADSGQRQAAKAAAERLRKLGIGAIGGAPLVPEGAATPVQVRVLGRFEVLAGGRPVPLPAWRSRQARSLFKILVARRGRPVSRTEVCELLWPDDDPQRTGHRLSVLLSVIRTVLDPTKLWTADRHVRADLTGVSLDLDHVVVDAEELMRDAAHAAALDRAGQPDRARELLVEVDAAYRGDAFDDEPYEDWAHGLREEARAAWLRSLRQLAGLAARAGDADQAVAALVRLLAADPYDEPAHRALVAVLTGAGRYGEARRAFDHWTRAMRAIDAPAPDRSLLRGDAASRTGPAPHPPVRLAGLAPAVRPVVRGVADGEVPEVAERVG